MLYPLAPLPLLWLDAMEYCPGVFVIQNAPLGRMWYIIWGAQHLSPTTWPGTPDACCHETGKDAVLWARQKERWRLSLDRKQTCCYSAKKAWVHYLLQKMDFQCLLPTAVTCRQQGFSTWTSTKDFYTASSGSSSEMQLKVGIRYFQQ